MRTYMRTAVASGEYALGVDELVPSLAITGFVENSTANIDDGDRREHSSSAVHEPVES